MPVVPLTLKEVDFNKIQLNEVQKMNNRKIVKLSYNNERFLIQTPELYFTKNIVKNNNIYELNIPLFCHNESKNNFLLNFFNKIDHFMIEQGKANSAKWFETKNKIKYKSIIRKTNIQHKIYKNGVFKLKMKNTNDVKITLEQQNKPFNIFSLPELSKIKLVFEPYAIWITKDGYGLYIKPVLLDFRLIYDVSFADDSEDEYDILDTEFDMTTVAQSTNENTTVRSSVKHTNHINEDDESSVKSKTDEEQELKSAFESHNPETHNPETHNPETQRSESHNPETQRSETHNPETQRSESHNPETQRSETHRSETHNPETQLNDETSDMQTHELLEQINDITSDINNS